MERQREENGADGEDARAKRARIAARIEEAKVTLFDHARRGELQELQSLVNSMSEEDGERSEFINVTGGGGWTILHFATLLGHLPLISWILSDSGGRAAGFDTGRAPTDDDGRTALHIAAHDRRFEVFLAIVEGLKVENGERAAMMNAVNNNRYTLLHAAARSGSTPMISWILSDSGGRAAGFNKVLAKTKYGELALHIAAEGENLETFLALIEGCKVENGERDAIFSAVDDIGCTVLHRAAMFGRVDMVKWLLSEKGREAGFSREIVFALTNKKESILHYAIIFVLSIDCLDFILSYCRNAEEWGRLLFGVDSAGCTVLHHAAVRAPAPILEWVVSHQQEARGGSNEDLFALTNDKKSVLHLAAGEGSVDIFDFLLSCCNNTSDRLRLFLGRDNKGWTIFFHAARNNQRELISHILRKYPEESKMIINARDYRGMTAVHRMIIGGLDEEGRKEWPVFQMESGKRSIIAALLGFEDIIDDDENDDDFSFDYNEVDDNDVDDAEDMEDFDDNNEERDVVAMDSKDNEEDGEEKKAMNIKKANEMAAAGADPNVGLKFD